MYSPNIGLGALLVIGYGIIIGYFILLVQAIQRLKAK